uniref:ATP synthase subunit a n=1 Tax=Nasonia giraulti TaxID=7426 RepID=B5T2D4_9HYME|nr:ATP synthase F0 subunit 6 [Nasonia giraulti]UVN15315.1 ATP synthase F0 subunit 6 [Nasonia oneida]ACH81755.1 ATP synthase subunit 6 [Nasonia giraulti]ACH85640.1 ATP synthase subunit 6 [Nasonia giraulti]ACH85648.1 ATP synthase subunit 6 [Nasonia giraulti]ACH85652.1 ATP synthase subunit 6 [Nasonia giraulti]
MMMNLFSIFDPSTSMNLSMNWISSVYIILFYPNLFWLIPSRWNYLYINMIKYLINEFFMLLNNKINVMNMIMFISLFMMIMLNNFLGLYPYIYTSSSQMSMSMTLSLTLWMMMMMFGWMINTNHMFIHLVPQGTPSMLMPFMVMIESISNIIRPLTLAVRLSANMIAGHLLMTLISSTGNKLNMVMLSIMLLTQSVLIILELSVSVIQAYVFSVLSLLYSTETN